MSVWAMVSAERVRLVGRDQEFARLEEALRAAAAGRPGIVLVGGEAGIGKTRLVEELAEHASAEGMLVATGHCSPVTGTRLPYGPVVDLVADLLGQQPELPGRLPPEVWRAVAPLIGWADQEPPAPDLGLASTRLFVGFVELVAAMSRRRPVLLVIEDLHWADPASVDLIAFTARGLRHRPILLVLTHRPDDTAPRAPARSALAELRRLPSAIDVGLGPLSPEATKEMLLALGQASAQIHGIVQRCGGIPFFALHLAEHEAGAIMPPHLRDVLLTSLDHLSRGEKALLVLLTVLGDALYDDLLVKASGAPAKEFSRRVRALVDRGLIKVRDGRIGFRHALLREVVVQDTLPSERVVAHARAADALLGSAAARQPHRAGQLAHHLLECGRHLDAIRYAIRAARHARSIWAFSDARSLFAAVLRLWPLVEQPECATGIGYPELLREAAMASRWCGRLDESLELLHEALDLPDGSPVARAETEHAYGLALWAAGDMGASLAAYRRAEALLPADTDARLRSAVLAALAHGLMATGHSREAERTARAAVRLASSVGAERERLHASITAAAARAQLGDVDEAVAALRTCLPQARRLDDLELVLRCYGNLTFAFGIGCRYEELAAAAAEGLAVCKHYGPVVSLASTLINNQVTALIMLGRWDEAVEVATTALEDATAGSVGLHLRVALVDVAVARGDAEQADRLLAQLDELGAENPYAASALCVARAERALWEHRPQEAAASIARALPSLQTQDDALPVLEACWLGLRAAADVAEGRLPQRRRSGGDLAPPSGLLDIARDAAQRSALPVAAVILATGEAEADRITGADTVAQWTAAVASNADLRRRYPQAYCLMRLGVAQLRRQARSAAELALSEGLRLARTLGAGPLVSEIRTVATLGGVRLEARVDPGPGDDGPPVNPYRLTPREREILVLLTTGATNRVIGRTLFISERTVSVHVSNLMAKLGAANRTEAARLALRMNLDR